MSKRSSSRDRVAVPGEVASARRRVLLDSRVPHGLPRFRHARANRVPVHAATVAPATGALQAARPEGVQAPPPARYNARRKGSDLGHGQKHACGTGRAYLVGVRVHPPVPGQDLRDEDRRGPAGRELLSTAGQRPRASVSPGHPDHPGAGGQEAH